MILPLGEAAARLATATIAGAVLGANRNLRGKSAGLRTHALVALGAALVTAAASGADPAGATRVMQGVITGIGFLGAGVILHPRAPTVVARPAAPRAPAVGRTRRKRPRRTRDVRGLTTAATVWVAAGLGLASGLGAWALVLLGTGLTLAILVGGGAVEDGVRRRLLRGLRRRRVLERRARVRRALEHHDGPGDVVRVGEGDVRPHDA